jgi:hypothetical protein
VDVGEQREGVSREAVGVCGGAAGVVLEEEAGQGDGWCACGRGGLGLVLGCVVVRDIDSLSCLAWWGVSVLVNTVLDAVAETHNPARPRRGPTPLVSLPGIQCHGLLDGVGAVAREWNLSNIPRKR